MRKGETVPKRNVKRIEQKKRIQKEVLFVRSQFRLYAKKIFLSVIFLKLKLNYFKTQKRKKKSEVTSDLSYKKKDKLKLYQISVVGYYQQGTWYPMFCDFNVLWKSCTSTQDLNFII